MNKTCIEYLSVCFALSVFVISTLIFAGFLLAIDYYHLHSWTYIFAFLGYIIITGLSFCLVLSFKECLYDKYVEELNNRRVNISLDEDYNFPEEDLEL